MPYYYGYDISSLIWLIPAMIFALWAQHNVKSTFQKYSKVQSFRGMTGYDAARLILDANGLHHVRIEAVAGDLTDHYDPKTNVIRLSETVHSARTAAAVGVAAHEAGHAVQYAESYLPIKLRAAIIPVTNIGSSLSWPLVLLGILLSWRPVAMLGVVLFSLSVVFQLLTLPVEFNASKRAMRALEECGILNDDELKGARKVLTAAAMTYVAALATSVMQIFYYTTVFNRRRK